MEITDRKEVCLWRKNWQKHTIRPDWKSVFTKNGKRGAIFTQKIKLKTNKIILIEIKDINIDTIQLTKLLNKYKTKNIYVMSFFNSVIKKINNNLFKIGILNYILNSTTTYNYDFMGILYDVASPHLINSLKKLNITVFLYAINKKDKLSYPDIYYIVDAN